MMRQEITDCYVCINPRVCKRYYGEWICEDCISLVARLRHKYKHEEIDKDALMVKAKEFLNSRSAIDTSTIR